MTTIADRQLTCRTHREGQVYVHPRTHATVRPKPETTHLVCELCDYVVRLPDRVYGEYGAEEVRRRHVKTVHFTALLEGRARIDER